MGAMNVEPAGLEQAQARPNTSMEEERWHEVSPLTEVLLVTE